MRGYMVLSNKYFCFLKHFKIAMALQELKPCNIEIVLILGSTKFMISRLLVLKILMQNIYIQSNGKSECVWSTLLEEFT